MSETDPDEEGSKSSLTASPVFISGPMGSGKSTVGRALADRLDASFEDLDAVIEHRAGRSIREIFDREGEVKFRKLEAEALRSVLEQTRETRLVLALGGGTVLNRASRRLLLASGVLVTLEAPIDVLAARVAKASGRPLLAAGDAKAILRDLVRERRPAYAECHGSVGSDRSVEEIVDAIEELAARPPVPVPLGDRSYAVQVGTGRLGQLPLLLHGATGVLFAVDENVLQCPWLPQLLPQALEDPVPVPAGEAHKTIQTVESIWDAALRRGLDRHAVFVAVGGGVTGDLVGFAAATFLRGVEVIQVPTTLLAMVDSSVGGKTGFDRREGKNLIGAFHQPKGVLCDLATLDTLPDRELRAGLAEVVKTAWIEGDRAVKELEARAPRLLARDREALEQAIRRAVACKRDVVAADEREAGPRRLLNFGHTIGHALEAAAGYQDLLHGEAVALGLVAIMKIGMQLGVTPSGQLDRMVRLLDALELPSDLPKGWEQDAADFVSKDKKRVGESVALVLAKAPGSLEIVPVQLKDIDRLLAACAGGESP